MFYLLPVLLCASYVSAIPMTHESFRELEKTENKRIEIAAQNLVQELHLTQERSLILLHYLKAAQKMAEAEAAFMTAHAQVLHSLAYIKEAQSYSEEERTVFAHQLARLNRLVGIKSACAIALADIEDYLDEHELYADMIHAMSESLKAVLTEALEKRYALIDSMLLDAHDTLDSDTFLVIGRFCKVIAEEPELLAAGDSLAMKKIDIVHRLSRQIGVKVAEIAEVQEAMNQVVYFTLLVTHTFFKHCCKELQA